jgi:1-acyl-sn-glycerol-3-phosphate acyltransferase
MVDAKSSPKYHFPFHLACGILGSLFLKTSRTLQRDATIFVRRYYSRIEIIGIENIPRSGPALVTMNHYAREGFSIVWAVLTISAKLPKNQLWLMTNTWTSRENGLDILRTIITKYLFKRIADIYGLITTPAMPPVESEIVERALSIRRVIQHVKNHPSTIVCLAPEGRDYPFSILGQPPPGTGKFVYQLANYLEKVIPVGVYEKCDKLIINFGPAYQLSKISDHDDEKISRIVMERIRMQLPDSFHLM